MRHRGRWTMAGALLAAGMAAIVGGGSPGGSPADAVTATGHVPLPANVSGVVEGISSQDLEALGLPGVAPPNPEIAAGPGDVLLAAGGTISRARNPGDLRRQLLLTLNLRPGLAQRLDTWLGAPVMDTFCPTAPRTPESCLLGDPVVRYDQMQGRFLAAFTVTDTGRVGGVVTQARKASFALLVSRFPDLGDAPFLAPGTAEGVNPDVWNLFTGDLNALPGIPGSAAAFDCSPAAVGAGPAVCYFPTSARLGLDNDTIQIVASVYNDNVPDVNRGPDYNPPFTEPAYAGTRVRVIKKTAIYTRFGGSVTFGNQFDPTEANRFQGEAYDLYTSNGLGVPALLRPYTAVASTALPALGQPVTPPQSPSVLFPLYYEPAHLRGRTLATYSNFPVLRNGAQSSQSYLVGTVSTPEPATTNQLFILRIQNVYGANPPGSGPPVFYPTLGSGTTIFSSGDPASQSGLPESLVLPNAFRNAREVFQANAREGLPAPTLYVGDDRPTRVISREGHHYDARVVFRPAVGGLDATVAHDIVRKLGPTSPATLFVPLGTTLTAFAPGLDVHAGVTINAASTVSQATLQPLLDRLFVGTTFPQLRDATTPPGYPGGLETGTGLPLPAAQCRRTDPLAPAAVGYAGLFDIRCGEDAYDTASDFRHPVTGALVNAVRWSQRGGASTDPNNLGLWLYGAYARGRLSSLPGPGQWGTYVAHYPLSFPLDNPYTDVPQVPPTTRGAFFFGFSQVARHTGIGPPGPVLDSATEVTREEAAQLVIRSQMDEQSITDYLNATGGAFCSFADVTCPGAVSGPGTESYRYIETMARRGYTRGCALTSEPQNTFCPGQLLTRGELGVFIIRPKLGNVFPTLLTGCPPGQPLATCGAGTDNLGQFVTASPFFADVPPGHPYFVFIQKLRELRLSAGFTGGRDSGQFRPDAPVSRGQTLVTAVRGFLP